MTVMDISACVSLIERAMNAEEARQAEETFRFHFVCQNQGVDDGRRYWVLNDVGLIGLHRYQWGPSENVWLAWFAVDPDFQGQGLGKALIQMATEEACRLGYRKLFIETYSTPEFARARAFYQAQEFAEMGQVRNYLPDGGDMIVYAKSLIPHSYESIDQRAGHMANRTACQFGDSST